MRSQHPLDWTVGHQPDNALLPERFVPALVPGAVQLDWAAAEGWGDPHYADNWKDYLWMEDVYWLYRTTIGRIPVKANERLFFVCGGVDYQFEIRLNGSVIHEQEGMFTPVELELTGRAGAGDTLEVLVYPAPKSRPQPADRSQANQSCKPAVSYSWDFHPRLIPLGIWKETFLEVRPALHLTQAEVFYELNEALTRAEIRLDVQWSGAPEGQLRWQLFGPDGQVVLSREAPCARVLTAGLDNPLLWWPHDQGSPWLYTSRLELLDAGGGVQDILESKVGFRRVALVMHEGAWDFPDIREFPKSRSHPPITLEINGRRIFAKGSNWVCPDIFPGRLTVERYRELLLLARGANMNLLRNWGGAIVPHECFHSICDELGLMVWQEFPLSCNRYEGTPGYMKVLDQESRSILCTLRSHPSVVLWCGGNELFNVWSGMTDQDLPLRLLNRNCFDLDPQRPFLPTSPVHGMGHGHYLFRGIKGEEVFQIFAPARCNAYTEFGCPAPSNEETIRGIIPPEDLFPPRTGTAWASHHAFGAWADDSHLQFGVLEDYFGPCADLGQLVERGQFLQGEGLKCVFEEARRQKPRAAMALNWCFAEPWPAAANMSIINYPSAPKAGYYEVGKSLRPVLASARIPRFVWKENEEFSVDLFLLNDSPQALPAGCVEAWLLLGGTEILMLRWDHAGTSVNTNLAGPTARLRLPAVAADRLRLELRVPQSPEWNSSYSLSYRCELSAAEGGTRRLNM